MKKNIKKATAALLAIVSVSSFIFLFTGCRGNKSNKLPDVVTHPIPDEKVKSTVVSDEMTIDIHSSYAEIKHYSGTASEITIPASAAGIPVRVIGEEAFKNNKKLKKVIFPSSLLAVGRFAFENCSGLKEAVFNDGLETIGDYAFKSSGLSVLDLPDSVSGIGKYSFYGVDITYLKIPANVSVMGKYAFYGCEKLEKIDFCPRISEISENAFYNCNSLTEVVIPRNIVKIDDYAFKACRSLTKIVIPEETEKIGEGVFAECEKVTVYAPKKSEAEKNAKRNGYAFKACDYDSEASGLKK